jgi:hypothetical protein
VTVNEVDCYFPDAERTGTECGDRNSRGVIAPWDVLLKRHGADAVVQAPNIPLRTHDAAAWGKVPLFAFFARDSRLPGPTGDYSLDNPSWVS